MIEVYRSRSVRKWKSPVVRGYRDSHFLLEGLSSLGSTHELLRRQWQVSLPGTNKSLLQYMKRKVLKPRGLTSILEGSRKTTRGEKDKRTVGGGRRISDRGGERC